MFTLRAGVISTDPTWENIGAAIWSSIELNTSIIASALPTLRPLITRMLPGMGFSTAGTKHSNYPRYGNISGVGRATASRTHETKSSKVQSISVEELTLKDMNSSPSGSISAGIYSHASADHAGRFSPQEGHDERRIVKTTEISVNSGSRSKAF